MVSWVLLCQQDLIVQARQYDWKKIIADNHEYLSRIFKHSDSEIITWLLNSFNWHDAFVINREWYEKLQ